MKVSAKGEYGVRAMAILALEFHEGPFASACNCRAGKYFLTVLEQIFLPLRRAGLIESVRGAKGDICWQSHLTKFV